VGGGAAASQEGDARMFVSGRESRRCAVNGSNCVGPALCKRDEVSGDRIGLANSQGEQSPRFWVHSVLDDFRALSSWCGGSGGNHRN
jgi:hypothetical protein